MINSLENLHFVLQKKFKVYSFSAAGGAPASAGAAVGTQLEGRAGEQLGARVARDLSSLLGLTAARREPGVGVSHVLEQLCIEPEHFCWLLNIDLLVYFPLSIVIFIPSFVLIECMYSLFRSFPLQFLSCDGNLVSAASIAVKAALSNVRSVRIYSMLED